MQHHQPTKTNQLRYLNHIEFTNTSTIQMLLEMNKPTISDAVKAKLQMVKEQINEQFDTDIDLNGKVESTLQQRRTKLLLYRRLLSQVDPSLVVLGVSYSKETLIENCQKKDIIVV